MTNKKKCDALGKFSNFHLHVKVFFVGKMIYNPFPK